MNVFLHMDYVVDVDQLEFFIRVCARMKRMNQLNHQSESKMEKNITKSEAEAVLKLKTTNDRNDEKKRRKEEKKKMNQNFVQ